MSRPLSLPEDWVAKRDEEGNTYFLNKLTKKINWNISDIIQEGETARPSQTSETALGQSYSAEEARRVLINLFREKGVTGEMSWERTFELLHGETRFQMVSCPKERKRIFKQFVESERAAVRKRVFDQKQQAKSDLKQMLAEYRHITTDTKFQSLVPLFFQDPRWKALEERDREVAFQEYLEELFVKENQNEKEAIARRCEKLRLQMLELRRVSSSTTWEEARELMYYNPNWNDLHDYYRLQTFKDFVVSLRELEAAGRARAKAHTEQLQRINFVRCLVGMVREDVFTFQTNFEDLREKFANEESFYDILGQEAITPGELFAQFRVKLIEQHREVKNSFKLALKRHVDSFSRDISLENFAQVLREIEEFADFGTRFNICNSFSFFTRYLHKKLIKRQKKAVNKIRRFLERHEAPSLYDVRKMEEETRDHRDKKYFDSLPANDRAELIKEYLSHGAKEDNLHPEKKYSPVKILKEKQDRGIENKIEVDDLSRKSVKDEFEPGEVWVPEYSSKRPKGN